MKKYGYKLDVIHRYTGEIIADDLGKYVYDKDYLNAGIKALLSTLEEFPSEHYIVNVKMLEDEN